MLFKTTLLASSALLLAMAAPNLANAQQTGTGKAHMIYIPDIDTPKLKIDDSSPKAGLAVGRAAPTTEGGLGIGIAGTTSKKKVYPHNKYDTKNFVPEEIDPIWDDPAPFGSTSYVPPGSCEEGCDSGMLVTDKAGETALEHGSYFLGGQGVIDETKNLRGAAVFGGYIGTPTALNDMAALKTGRVKATYEGSFMGIASTPGADIYYDYVNGVEVEERVENIQSTFVSGDVTMNADFRKGQVTGNVTDLTMGSDQEDGFALDQGLALKGKIKGSDYSGSVKITKGTGLVKGGGSVSSSALSGGFLGAGAAETAGALRMTGKITPTIDGEAVFDNGKAIKNAPIAITGSFGAVKTPAQVQSPTAAPAR